MRPFNVDLPVQPSFQRENDPEVMYDSRSVREWTPRTPEGRRRVSGSSTGLALTMVVVVVGVVVVGMMFAAWVVWGIR